ncbi:retrovirus-related Pol polyprotein LINE-1, partial [Elysia marginata]
MRKTDIDPNDIALISHLYWTQNTKVRVGKDLSDEVDIKKGVRQGCVLSPSLFNLYTEYIFREIDDVPGLKVNSENINNLNYADDTVLLAESENGLQNLVTIIEEKSEQLTHESVYTHSYIVVLPNKHWAGSGKYKQALLSVASFPDHQSTNHVRISTFPAGDIQKTSLVRRQAFQYNIDIEGISLDIS